MEHKVCKHTLVKKSAAVNKYFCCNKIVTNILWYILFSSQIKQNLTYVRIERVIYKNVKTEVLVESFLHSIRTLYNHPYHHYQKGAAAVIQPSLNTYLWMVFLLQINKLHATNYTPSSRKNFEEFFPFCILKYYIQFKAFNNFWYL